jgi:OmpA-OmpF porin, OOP family
MNVGNLKRVVFASVAIMLFAVAGTAAAQGYIGAGAGITKAESDVCAGLSNCDDEDTGMKIFGGFKFNPNVGLEASWVDLGEVSASVPGGTATGEVDGFGLAVVGMIPLNEKFGLFGKVGAYMWDSTVSAPGFGSVSDDGTDIMFGGGVNWNLTTRFGLRAEWERFDIDGDNIDFISIGAQFNF